jgi:hypothetical protein
VATNPAYIVKNIAPPFAANGPGVHALVIGVSAYTYLANGAEEAKKTYNLGQLDSAAQTAASVSEWLLDASTKLRQPIKSLRFLASPSRDERHPMLQHAVPATLENVHEALWQWRADASVDREDTTIFYFAGHGIQRARGDSFLLLEGFNEPKKPLLSNAVDLNLIYNGMAEAEFPNIAQIQLYFVDSCRTDIPDMTKFLDPEGAKIWDITLGGADTRVAPIFFASAAGAPTFGSEKPGGVSAFGTDFLKCVRGSAADSIKVSPGKKAWSVTIGTLARTLQKFVEAHNSNVVGRPRKVVVDKFTQNEAVIATLPGPPTVTCRVVFVPDDAHTVATLSFEDATGVEPSFDIPLTNPHIFDAVAGSYKVFAQVSADQCPPYRSSTPEHVSVLPPETEVTVYLGDAV